MSYEVRTQQFGTINFSALNRELSVPMDISRLSELLDIEMQMYSTPAVEPLINSAQLTGGEDFRLYLNTYNVTECLIEEFGLQLSNIKHDVLSKAYLNGARKYLDFARYLNVPSGQNDDDWKKAQEIASDTDWASKISTLGDYRVGWSGNLHCLNFLYRFLPLRPVSLSKIWGEYVNKHQLVDVPQTLSKFEQLVITFSQGGSPSYDTFATGSRHPTGRLVYQLELHYKNPLESRLREIARKLRDVHRQLEVQRIDYLTPIKSGVETANDDIDQGYSETKIALDRLTETVKKIR